VHDVDTVGSQAVDLAPLLPFRRFLLHINSSRSRTLASSAGGAALCSTSPGTTVTYTDKETAYPRAAGQESVSTDSKCSLPHSQKPTTGLYHKAVPPSSRFHNIYSHDPL
jgi:hypothetical protein